MHPPSQHCHSKRPPAPALRPLHPSSSSPSRSQKRFLAEEPDEAKWRLADSHYLTSLTRRTFNHCREELLKTAEIEAKRLQAEEMWERIVLPRLWHRWSYRAACLAHYRRGLVRVWLQAIELDTHNSMHQAPRVAVSHAYERATLLSWIWIGVREFAKDIIKNREQVGPGGLSLQRSA